LYFITILDAKVSSYYDVGRELRYNICPVLGKKCKST